MGVPQRVFVSYSHDSDAHRDWVLALAQHLRRDGFDCRIDRFINGAPDEGWPRWIQNELEHADHVLVVCTEIYYRRFRGQESPLVGRGSTYEGAIITQELYEADTNKFLAVIPPEGSPKHVPESLRPRVMVRLGSRDDYDNLVAILRGTACVQPLPIGSTSLTADSKNSTLLSTAVSDTFALPSDLLHTFDTSGPDYMAERELLDAEAKARLDDYHRQRDEWRRASVLNYAEINDLARSNAPSELTQYAISMKLGLYEDGKFRLFSKEVTAAQLIEQIDERRALMGLRKIRRKALGISDKPVAVLSEKMNKMMKAYGERQRAIFGPRQQNSS